MGRAEGRVFGVTAGGRCRCPLCVGASGDPVRAAPRAVLLGGREHTSSGPVSFIYITFKYSSQYKEHRYLSSNKRSVSL